MSYKEKFREFMVSPYFGPVAIAGLLIGWLSAGVLFGLSMLPFLMGWAIFSAIVFMAGVVIGVVIGFAVSVVIAVAIYTKIIDKKKTESSAKDEANSDEESHLL